MQMTMIKYLCVIQVIILFSRGMNSEKPQVSQKFFKVAEDGSRVIGFSCTAYVETGETMTWWQIKGNANTGRGIIHSSSTSNQMTIYHNITLQRKDNGTYIYCQKASAGGKNKTNSDSVPIIFNLVNPPDTPFVNVIPDASPLYFAVNETKKFFCNGSTPIAGRRLRWFIKAPDSEPKYVEGQLWNNVTNESNLALRFDETHNGTQLYCAQIYVTDHMQMNGTYRRDWIGENSRSKEITLLQKPIEDKGSREDRGTDTSEEIEKPEKNENYVTDDSNTENENDMKEAGLGSGVSPLSYAIPIGVAVLLASAAAAAWVYRRRRRRAPIKTEGNEEAIYAVPQVQYATLDLQSPTTEYASSLGDKSPYAKIIGVYRPTLTR